MSQMDPVTLIVTALAAGAASALQDGATQAVKDAYAKLRGLVRERFAGRPKGELVLAEHEAAPQTWETPLAAELAAAGAAGDVGLLTAAQVLLSLVDEAGSQSGKYVVTVRDSEGVQVGDRNTQTNTFGAGPGARD
jgi:hypothetical protein